MKKLILMCNMMFVVTVVALAQETTANTSTSKGTWLIETNTGFGGIHPANTGLSFRMTNGSALWNIGGEGGYFLTNRLALKVGLGFGNFATGSSAIRSTSESGTGGGEGAEGGAGLGEAGETGSGGTATIIPGTGGQTIAGLGAILSYKLGVKYYLIDRIPLQIDFSGTNVSGYNFEVGMQAGYAFFLGQSKNISIEPGVRYSIPVIQRPGTIGNQLQMNIGFAFMF